MATKQPKWPHVSLRIDLSGPDGGPHMVIARALGACRKAGIPVAEVENFRAAIAAQKDYSEILGIVGKFISFNDGEYL